MEVLLHEGLSEKYYLRTRAGGRVEDVLVSLLRPGMTFFDAGAHWGYFALLGSAVVGQEGRSVAFEPDINNVERIRRNIALNPQLSVGLETVAIADHEGEATFQTGHTSDTGSIAPARAGHGGPAPVVAVVTTSLDSYLSENGIETVDVMKMDIEGAEVQAIEGMREGLAAGRYGHIVMEWHGAHHERLGDRPTKALALLASSGYELSVMRRPKGRLSLEPVTPESVPAERIHLLCRSSRQ